MFPEGLLLWETHVGEQANETLCGYSRRNYVALILNKNSSGRALNLVILSCILVAPSPPHTAKDQIQGFVDTRLYIPTLTNESNPPPSL